MRTALSFVGIVMLAAVTAAGSDKTSPKAERLRVFVSESWSAETAAPVTNADGATVGTTGGSVRPQTAEIIKTLRASCKTANATLKREAADYVLLLEHEGGKVFGTDNKWVVFDRAGDAIGSGSTRLLGSSVKDACEAMTDHWSAKP